jgi:hypothetical protein
MIGYKRGEKLGPIRRFLCRHPGMFTQRALLFFSGVIWVKHEKPTVDWRHYLGPDWEPYYDNYST